VSQRLAERRVRRAAYRLELARAGVSNTVRVAYPVGARVEASIGRARIVGRVERHAESWWRDPAEIVLRNERTGKLRRVSATSEDAALVRLDG
jgi:hypothetical protein